MSVVGGIMVPHPPLIIPEVGRGQESVIRKTSEAYEKAAQFVADLKPDTIVVISPHTIMYSDYLHISPGYRASGDFGSFGAGQVRIAVEYDADLSNRFCELAEDAHIPAGYEGERDASLDHGTLVPLYFICKKYRDFKVVRVGISGIPLAQQYRFGTLIAQAAKEMNRRVVVVASGDLSHKLQKSGPYGFDPSGPVYDEKVMDVMGKGEFYKLLHFDAGLLDKAAECGHRSFVIMGGAFDCLSVETTKYSHQDVTGVGYGICTYKVLHDDETKDYLNRYEQELEKKREEQMLMEDAYVSLARRTIENYIAGEKLIGVPEGLPQEMYQKRAGAFVSLHIDGGLRGCIGTIGPTTGSVAEEIIQNAVSASTKDPRFSPVREEELPYLEYSVDVLGEPEIIDSPSQLDVKRYGVIVTKGLKRGLLLPDLDGVDTVEQQIAIAKQKAGIAQEDKKVQLERFEVIRHH
ncbi:MAG: AmmeMemoRadiSam system protein A [Eubacterium sp.]|nr:AmmeMemoRadiSam system protein A [Eubacterium sp.]